MEIQEQEITNFIQELLAKMGWGDSTVTTKAGDEGLEVSIKTYEAKYLIGSAGQNLQNLEHIIRTLVAKKFSYRNFIRVDINEYRKERERQLRELARSAAQKVSQTKRPIKLPPMNPAERKVIHTELSARPDVVTESEGEANQRQVVIKPYP